MSKTCSKCLKTVYPTEELKCLDKIWHKLCFKCEVCNMTLNMKNYKGFGKLPYCNAHCPTVKHTQVADTPETRRIAENSKIQSNIQYHAEFEKQKGQKTSVTEDPITDRVKQNQQVQSNVSYRGLREHRDQMESKRPYQVAGDVTRRPPNPGKISDYDPEGGSRDSPYSQRNSANVVYESQKGRVQSQRIQPGSIADYDPLNNQHSSVVRNSYSGSQSYQIPAVSADAPQAASPPYEPQQTATPVYEPPRAASPDIEPPRPESPDFEPPRAASPYIEPPRAASPNIEPPRASSPDIEPPRAASPDIEPPRAASPDIEPPQAVSPYIEPPQVGTLVQEPPQVESPVHHGHPAPDVPDQVVYRAIYDYVAADADEISFQDGDIILNVTVVDDGWMTGTVERTGQHGMLPSNYVEPIN